MFEFCFYFRCIFLNIKIIYLWGNNVLPAVLKTYLKRKLSIKHHKINLQNKKIIQLTLLIIILMMLSLTIPK